MKQFVLGISVFWTGVIFAVINYYYTLQHQVCADDIKGWYTSFQYNNTLIPFVISIVVLLIGVYICMDCMDDKNT